MQKLNLKSNYSKSNLEVVPLESTIKVQVPKDVLLKIQYLCQTISEVEWSGILLYKISGTIKNPEKCVLVLKDIIPMNKGSQAYTEFEYNTENRESSEDRMIDYFNDNIIALEEDWKIGLIHSHNTMSVFFSKTDMDELIENSNSHNFYLSVIVNNAMDICGKVGMIGYSKNNMPIEYSSLDENGESFKISSTDLEIQESKMFTYDCEFNRDTLKVRVKDETFLNSVKDIIKKEEVKVVNKGNYWKPQPKSKTHTYDFNKFRNFPNKNLYEDWYDGWGNDFTTLTEPLETDETTIEKFGNDFISSLFLGKIVEDPLSEIVEASHTVDPFGFRLTLMKRFPEVFTEFYPEGDDEDFYEIIEYIQESLENVKNQNFLIFNLLIETFDSILKKYSDG